MLLILWLLLPICLFAQNDGFHKFTKADGLPSNAIYGVLEDKQGFIWVYTEKGISKYDGYAFKNFGLQDGLLSLDVWGLSEDKKGRIWIHNFEKPTYIKDDIIHQVRVIPEQSIEFRGIYEEANFFWTTFRDNRFFLQQDTFFMQPLQIIQDSIERGNCVLYKPEAALCFTEKAFIECDLSGAITNRFKVDTILINTLFDFKKKNPTRKNKKYPLVTPNINDEVVAHNDIAMHREEDGLLLITQLGIGKWYYDGRKSIAFSFKEKFNLLPNGPIDLSYRENFDGQIQVYIRNKLLFEVDTLLNVLDTFTLNTADRSNNAYKDREGNYWIAKNNKGLYFKANQAKNTKVFVEPNDERILSLTSDFQGNVFYGTDNGGAFHFKNGVSTRLVSKSMLGKDVNDLLLTSNGGLFFGGQKNAFYITTNPLKSTWKAKNINDDFEVIFSEDFLNASRNINRDLSTFKAGFNVKSLAWDNDNNTLWLSNGNSLANFNFTNFNRPIINQISFHRVTSIIPQENGSMWIGTINGLKKIEHDIVIDKGLLDPLLQQNIMAMAMDKAGVLWVGTEGSGVYGFKHDSIFRLSSTKRDFILSVFVDYENKLWIGTENGAKQFDLGATMPGKTQFVKTYSLTDGLLSNEVNAIAVDSQYIYFGTNKGLAQIQKTTNQKEHTKPLLHLQSIQVNGLNVPLDSVYHLEHDENELILNYTGLSYQSFGNLTYQYQLENADNDWQTTTNREVRYPKLAAGHYIFNLKTIDVNGITTQLKQPIHFIIHPPFWATTWFILLVILAILGVFWGIYKIRLGQIIAKEAAQTAINKKFAELELQALQSQMNPHFVFNSLASIQYFIQENNADEAEDYLAKFAKLMRLFLESSKTKYTTLEEEIKLIRLYIEMEQMRFEKRFDINILGMPDLDTFSIKIPTMILQPFIENAIHHGLFHKKEKGILTIDYCLSSDKTTLICIIEDNGIGRAAAKKIRQDSIKGYKSRGMQIVEERLNVLRSIENYDVHIDIKDLFHIFEQPSGTKVTITIPLVD